MPGPHTSRPHPEHVIYPYLLGHLCIDRPNLVWSSDITYVPMARGFLYLVAVIDWYSRYVLAWALSNTLEGSFCVEALEAALAQGEPVVFNTDQGAQFTSEAFTGQLKQRQILISMDGRGRALDNVFIERLWRTLKYEDIYLRDYADGHALHHGLERYFAIYNHAPPHSALGGRTPAEVHGAGAAGAGSEAAQADWVWTIPAANRTRLRRDNNKFLDQSDQRGTNQRTSIDQHQPPCSKLISTLQLYSGRGPPQVCSMLD